MTVSHCLIPHAHRIAKLPVAQWRGELDKLPETCAHADCGKPRNCRQRNADYLRGMWLRRKALKAARRAA